MRLKSKPVSPTATQAGSASKSRKVSAELLVHSDAWCGCIPAVEHNKFGCSFANLSELSEIAKSVPVNSIPVTPANWARSKTSSKSLSKAGSKKLTPISTKGKTASEKGSLTCKCFTLLFKNLD